MTDVLAAAQHLALDLGWPVLPVKPHGKAPLTPHGVKDATTDERTILHWRDRYGDDFNLGVATGAPGPSVLDVDDLDAASGLLGELENGETPESATGRPGKQLFYLGTSQGTLSLGFGELRQRGSYVVVPPSIHPNGKEYVWLVEPLTRRLLPVPAIVIADKVSAGVGELAVREEKVGHGQRHDYLKDVAVRLLRGGITDAPSLVVFLTAALNENCELVPPPKPTECEEIAAWAVKTRIAARERNVAKHAERETAGEPPAPKLDAPRPGASTGEHLDFIARNAGLPDGVRIKEVRRYGLRPVDRMEIDLSDGALIVFARQEDAARRQSWQRAVVLATSGSASPPLLKDTQLVALLGSLCRVAHVPRVYREAEELDETLRAFLALAEPVLGYTLATPADRYDLIVTLRAREPWDPTDRNTMGRPALVTDRADDARYVRAGELQDWFRIKGARIAGEAFPGRMAMVGLERVRIGSRERAPLEPRKREEPSTVLYRLREVVE